jgi:hypothetical protein
MHVAAIQIVTGEHAVEQIHDVRGSNAEIGGVQRPG